jgi:hypothetical protein
MRRKSLFFGKYHPAPSVRYHATCCEFLKTASPANYSGTEQRDSPPVHAGKSKAATEFKPGGGFLLSRSPIN